MIKRFFLVLSFVLVPGALMAQHADHGKQHASKAAHMNFARELIAAKADLKLTTEQISRLEAFAIKMDEHHKKMEAGTAVDTKMKEGAHAESKLHTDLLSVFTEAQLVKVRPMMKAHMDKCEHMKNATKAQHKH
jgi:hypothetical protein